MLLMLSAMGAMATASTADDNVSVVSIQGAIGPAVADYVTTQFSQLNSDKNVKLIILRMDTPGGLSVSMRKIVQSVLSSKVPVVGFVGPRGARAASAGTFILYATSVAAMAPGTNLGAASPVSLMSDDDKDAKADASAMQKKVMNDATAYIRSLAEAQGRNAKWAESAVTSAATLTAAEALDKNVINLMAEDVPDLLKKLDGMAIRFQGKPYTVKTQGLAINTLQPNWHARFVMTITNPSLAYILLMVGLLCLAVEFFHPGMLIPGVVGAICLLLALYAFQMLPINYIGLGLIVLGVVLIVAEVFVASLGILGIGGAVALLIGSIFLIPAEATGFGISKELVYGVPAIVVSLLGLLLYFVIKDRRRPPISNMDSLVGKAGTVMLLNDQYWLKCRGDLLQIDNPSELSEGDHVRVVKMVGARVKVAR